MALETLRRLYADIDAIDKAISLMQWDRQVLMPPGAGEARTAHLGRLTRMAHELLTSDELRQALDEAKREVEEGSIDAAFVRELAREVENEAKLPVELVERKAKVSSDAYDVWKRAKAENDFPSLAPYLEELFDIARETSRLLGYEDHPYDPLIDLFEAGAKTADAQRMFDTIRQPIIDLVREIRERGPVDDAFLKGEWDQARLRDFAEYATSKIGFDYARGRLNLAPNAFCATISTGDVRMTTRPSDHVKGVVSSSLHEAGHGVYEQGCPPEWNHTPLAGGVSHAVHESQSRLWENIVGRSRPFWEHFLPELKRYAPVLEGVSLEAFYRAMNVVKPEPIRVGADELTYNLHILVRFELEVDLITNRLAVRDLPEAWNAKYEEYLGITPSGVGEGCIQDVHWTRGYVGYFPTYAMGNLIGGQIWKTLRDDIPNTDELMRRGDFAPILSWLQEKVYRHAKSIPAPELVTRVTGRPMGAEDWLEYARGKYRALYLD